MSNLINKETGFEIATTPEKLPPLRNGYMRLIHQTSFNCAESLAENGLIYNRDLAQKDGFSKYSDVTLPILPIALGQCAVCYIAGFIFGLPITVNILYALVFTVPAAVFFIALGLLCGSVFNDKQVGGICGALLTNLAGWLSGIWFDLSLVGGVFEKIAYLLPFVHAVKLEQAVVAGMFSEIFPHIWWVIGYAAVVLVVSVLLFLRQMKRQ